MATHTIVTTGGTGNLPATNELPVDMWPKRQTAFAALTPLTVILSRLQVDTAHNFRVDATEEYEMPTEVEVGAALAAGGTALTVVAYGTTLVAGTLLYNPRTDDIASVDSNPTSNSVTVSRSIGGTTGAAWQAGDILKVMSPGIAENDETYRTTSMADENIYNYVQILKLQFAITRLQDKMTTHFGGAGSKRKQLQRQKYREFRIKEEQMRYFGGRSSSGTAPATVYLQGGVIHFLRAGTLYKDFNGALTESGWNNHLGNYCDQNPDIPVVNAFMAPNVKRIIASFAGDRLRTSPDSKRFGLRIDRWIGDKDVNLIPLPLLTDPECKGWGFFLDLTRIKLMDIERPMLHLEAKNVGESEKIIDTYRSVTSMLLANESRHSWWTGATN